MADSDSASGTEDDVAVYLENSLPLDALDPDIVNSETLDPETLDPETLDPETLDPNKMESTESVFRQVEAHSHATLDALLATHRRNPAVLRRIQSLVSGIPSSVLRWQHQHELAAGRRIERETERENIVRAFMTGPSKYYYVAASELYIQYTALTPETPMFTQVSLDDITHRVLTSTPKTIDWASKRKILAAIIRQIHARSVADVTPMPATIAAAHSVVDVLFLPGPGRRVRVKHFMTVMGDAILTRGHGRGRHEGKEDGKHKHKHTPAYCVSSDAAGIISRWNRFTSRYFGADLTKTIALAPTPNKAAVQLGIAVSHSTGLSTPNILNVLCVAAYYSYLHGSAPSYLENMADMHPELREFIDELRPAGPG